MTKLVNKPLLHPHRRRPLRPVNREPVNMKKKCVILVDGSNFYFKLKDLHLHNLLNLDFSGFAKLLAGNNKIVHATYYVGKIRTDGTEKTQTLFNNQRKLLSHLMKQGY